LFPAQDGRGDAGHSVLSINVTKLMFGAARTQTRYLPLVLPRCPENGTQCPEIGKFGEHGIGHLFGTTTLNCEKM